MVTDLVCGMQFEKEEAAAQQEYKGTTYYFCSQSCKEAFNKEPEKYAGKQEAGGDRPSGHR